MTCGKTTLLRRLSSSTTKIQAVIAGLEDASAIPVPSELFSDGILPPTVDLRDAASSLLLDGDAPFLLPHFRDMWHYWLSRPRSLPGWGAHPWATKDDALAFHGYVTAPGLVTHQNVTLARQAIAAGWTVFGLLPVHDPVALAARWIAERPDWCRGQTSAEIAERSYRAFGDMRDIGRAGGLLLRSWEAIDRLGTTLASELTNHLVRSDPVAVRAAVTRLVAQTAEVALALFRSVWVALPPGAQISLRESGSVRTAANEDAEADDAFSRP